MKLFNGIAAALIVATLAVIVLTFAGCGLDDEAPLAPVWGQTTPEHIRTAQAAVASVKSDVAAAKQAAESVASAHDKLSTAKASVAALPTPATTQKAEVQSQLDGADADLVSADSALGVTLANAAGHADQASTALTGAQKSAQADAAVVAKVQKQLQKSQDQVKELKAADPAKGWIEFVGVTCTLAGIALAVAALLASSIPVIGKLLQKLGDLAYEVAAALFGVGILLITLAHYLRTIELVLIWTGAGLAIIVLLIFLRRYWSIISGFIVGSGPTPAAPMTNQPSPLA